jgi:hypothetical protein
VGKGTVVGGLRKKRPDIWLSVSVTTRSPRPGEMDGREYHFVSDEAFDAMVARGELLEWASFAGHRYGTPREPVTRCIAAGVPALLEIDIAGARQVRRHRAARGHRPPAGAGGQRNRGRPGVRHNARQHVCQGRVRAAGSLDDGLIGPEHTFDGR